MAWPDGFQSLCLVVLAAAYALYFRNVPKSARRKVVRDIFLVALGAWAAEETSILRYGVYAYPEWWWLRLDRVPILIVSIWPMVVLSAQAVVDGLFPSRAGASRAALVGLVVTFDALLVEVLAVRGGLWAWTLPGYLDVPVIGVLGWGFYAAAITWALEQRRFDKFRWATPLVAVALTHAMLVAAWWALFKWVSVPLPSQAVYVTVLFAIAASFWLLANKARRIAWPTAIPRMVAALVFVVLLLETELQTPGVLAFHWLHLGATAMLYLNAVRWNS